MFIIPMAGLSSRFFKAGYDKPKYQLMLGKETVFSWSVKSFERYFQTDKFVFVYRNIYDTQNFIQSEIDKLGIFDYELVCLPRETLGQADTVYQGVCNCPDEELYIFNIDSKIVDFQKPSWIDECDGYLEVFKGEGNHWSFAQPQDAHSRKVIRTTEKERISDLCSDGLYYFKQKSVFERLFLQAKESRQVAKNEYYIAPLYNQLIKEQAVVYYDLVSNDKILFCGTPDEYVTILNGV